MEPLKKNVQQFSTGEADFVIDISPTYDRRPSDLTAFTIVKTVDFLNLYIELAKSYHPRTILELGVFQGGGFAFLDSVFRPDAMSAVELSKTPVTTLLSWIANRANRSVHFSTNQTDRDRLLNIVKGELGGVLDMVVDDASHSYVETRRSFEILFPIMSPGGHYIIEDWAWAHWESYQALDAPSANSPALSNLLFDLIMLQASTHLIAEIRVFAQLVIIRKSSTGALVPNDFWGLIRNRGRAQPRI